MFDQEGQFFVASIQCNSIKTGIFGTKHQSILGSKFRSTFWNNGSKQKKIAMPVSDWLSEFLRHTLKICFQTLWFSFHIKFVFNLSTATFNSWVRVYFAYFGALFDVEHLICNVMHFDTKFSHLRPLHRLFVFALKIRFWNFYFVLWHCMWRLCWYYPVKCCRCNDNLDLAFWRFTAIWSTFERWILMILQWILF